MKNTKPILVGASITFSVLLVYGMALVMKVLKGDFLLEKGLFDLGYLVLTLVIAVPLVIYILVVNGSYEKNILEVISFTSLFTIILFVAVYSVSVSEDVLSPEQLKNMIIIFLVTVVILIGTMHFTINNKWIKRW